MAEEPEVTTYRVDRPAKESAWLEARRPHFNASVAATLFAEHPFVTLADVVVEKLTGRARNGNRAMRRGQHLEKAVADWWSDEHSIQIVEPDQLYVRGPLMASLDRWVFGTNDALEVKTTAKHISEPERYWWWQCQAQIACADLDRVHLAVLDGSMDLQSFTVQRDEEAITLLLERAEEVMAAIGRGEVPADVDLSYRNLSTLHPTPTTSSVVLDDEALAAVAELGRIKVEQHELGEREETIKRLLAGRLGDAAEGRHPDDERLLVTWRSVTRRGLDERRLRAEEPELARRYGTTTTYRNMRLLER
jgi:predicted phage-related endonuclease